MLVNRFYVAGVGDYRYVSVLKLDIIIIMNNLKNAKISHRFMPQIETVYQNACFMVDFSKYILPNIKFNAEGFCEVVFNTHNSKIDGKLKLMALQCRS